MNGQLYQMARIISYVKKTNFCGQEAQFIKSDHEWLISYTFADKRSSSDADNETVNDTSEWSRILISKGLKKIFLLVRVSANDPKLAGFANSESQGIVTVYDDGKVSIWIPGWEFDNSRGMWNIYYIEKVLNDVPADYSTFENNIDSFRDILRRIQVFANEIGAKGFSSMFHDAYMTLEKDETPVIPKWMNGTVPELNDDALRMFIAASKADVFGGMGSWNDDPAGMAHAAGKGELYRALSNELYIQIRKAVMYAVNT